MSIIHRNGFTQLTNVTLSTDKAPNFNVVFVHGLRGHPRNTWTSKERSKPSTPRREWRIPFLGLGLKRKRAEEHEEEADDPKSTEGIFWPEALLASDLPRARLWTYGYNADVIGAFFKGNNKNSISQHANDLYVKLEREICQDNDDPIIFIAHSLGGIVVKDALNRSEISRKRTRLILFLGTPHKGSRYSDWGQIASNLCRVVLQDSNKHLLQSLEVNSEILDNINSQFVKNLLRENNIKVHSFQEAIGISGVKGLDERVVDPFSSKLDLPGIETIESIDANHMAMTKFDSKSNSGYRDILGVLKAFVPNLEIPKASHFDRDEEQSSLVSKDHRVDLLSLQPVIDKSNDNLATLPSRSRQRFSIPFEIPPGKIDDSISRSEEIERMRFHLSIDEIQEKRKILVICGLGGIGKTQLMIEFACAYKESYSAIFWLDGSSEDTLYQSILTAASRISHNFPLSSVAKKYKEFLQSKQAQDRENEDMKSSLGNLRDSVFYWLGDDDNNRWLWLIDNVDRTYSSNNTDKPSYDIQNFIPKSDHGGIVITTRQHGLGRQYARMDLSRMSSQQGIGMLAKSLDIREEDLPIESQTLVERLGGLPLALSQASAYIRESDVTIKEYLELYDKEWNTIMGPSSNYPDFSGTEYNQTVGTAWVLSYNSLRENDPDAAALLHVLAYFRGQSIQYSNILVDDEQASSAWIGTSDVPALVKTWFSRIKFISTMQSLLALSLAQKTKNDVTYEVHPVVQDWCLASASPKEQEEASYIALWLIGLSCKRVVEIPWQDSQNIRENLRLHALRCTEVLGLGPKSDFETYGAIKFTHLCSIASLYLILRDYQHAEPLFRQALSGLRRNLGRQHRITVHAAIGLCTSLLRNSDAESAKSTAEETIHDLEHATGVLLLKKTNLMFWCALANASLGMWEEAMALWMELLEIQSRFFLHERMIVLLHQIYFGRFLKDMGDLSRAETTFEECIEQEKEWHCLSPLSYYFLVAEDLTQLYVQQGKLVEARELLGRVLSERLLPQYDQEISEKAWEIRCQMDGVGEID